MKRAEGIDRVYLTNHAEEIINNTDALFPEWLWSRAQLTDDGEYLKDIFKQIRKKQLNESGNWYIFG